MHLMGHRSQLWDSNGDKIQWQIDVGTHYFRARKTKIQNENDYIIKMKVECDLMRDSIPSQVHLYLTALIISKEIHDISYDGT